MSASQPQSQSRSSTSHDEKSAPAAAKASTPETPPTHETPIAKRDVPEATASAAVARPPEVAEELRRLVNTYGMPEVEQKFLTLQSQESPTEVDTSLKQLADKHGMAEIGQGLHELKGQGSSY